MSESPRKNFPTLWEKSRAQRLQHRGSAMFTVEEAVQSDAENTAKYENLEKELAWVREVCDEDFLEQVRIEIQKLAERSRSKNWRTGELKFKNFKIKELRGAAGFVEKGSVFIHLTPKELKRLFLEQNVDLLRAIIVHEAVHVNGFYNSDEFNSKETYGLSTTQTGWGTFLNEGMTDTLASGILYRIYSRNGYLKGDGEQEFLEKIITYQPNVVLFMMLTSYIARKILVSESEVAGSFFKAYFDGGNVDGQFKNTLLEMLGADLYKSIFTLKQQSKNLQSNLEAIHRKLAEV